MNIKYWFYNITNRTSYSYPQCSDSLILIYNKYIIIYYYMFLFFFCYFFSFLC